MTMSPRFGFCLPIFACPGPGLFRTPTYAALDAGTTMALGRLADELGYDSLWVADHLMLGRDDAILEGWTTISALAGMTSRARLGMIHQANYFRNPALAAKMTATLDQISCGRLIHFLDIAHNGQEHHNFGLPWKDDRAARVADLVEATELILALWVADVPLSRTGTSYRVENAVCTPKPVQQPHPPVWFGEVVPEMLDACARFGNGWNTTPVSIPELRRRLATLGEACARHGRSLDDLELSLEMQILIAPDRDALRARFGEMLALATLGEPLHPSTGRLLGTRADHDELVAFVEGRAGAPPAALAHEWIIGTPDEVEARIRAYQAEGISHFMWWFMDAPSEDGLRLFAEEVAPRLRPARP